MESFWHDRRFGVKLAAARPGFTAVAVVTLALGIGPNAASLLLSRTASRRRELAVRAAVGARRGRLIRQMVTGLTQPLSARPVFAS